MWGLNPASLMAARTVAVPPPRHNTARPPRLGARPNDPNRWFFRRCYLRQERLEMWGHHSFKRFQFFLQGGNPGLKPFNANLGGGNVGDCLWRCRLFIGGGAGAGHAARSTTPGTRKHGTCVAFFHKLLAGPLTRPTGLCVRFCSLNGSVPVTNCAKLGSLAVGKPAASTLVTQTWDQPGFDR